MKVLFVSPTGTLDNGAEIAIVNLMKFLSSEGLVVHNVFPENQHPTYQKYLETMIEAKVITHPITAYQWWWEEAPNSDAKQVELLPASYQYAVSKIRKIIQTENIELVISNTINVFQGAVAAACENIRHFYLIHEFPFGEFAYYKEKINFINENSDAIYAVKGELFSSLSEYFPKEKMREFIPYSFADVHDSLVSVESRIVSIGKITERKNQLELIQAYHKLNCYEIPLVFIGGWDEEYKKKCDDYIHKHNLENIIFQNYQLEPWKSITDKDLCVFTSKLEAFPLVYIEAILNGIPVILSDNPGHLSVYNVFKEGQLYSLEDHQALVSKLEQVLDNFASFKEKSTLAAQFAREFYTVENIYRDIKEDILTKQSVNIKPNYSLRRLLDFSVTDGELFNGLQKKVSIYIGTENHPFSEETKIVHPLKKSDTIVLTLENGVSEVRVDLSELPSVYSEIRVITLNGNQELEPIDTNGIKHENGYLFLERDPYLVYEVSGHLGDKLSIEYKSNMIGSITYSGSDPYLKSLRERFNKLVSLERENQELLTLHREYQDIIDSRWWKLSTRFINFFRRKL